MDKVRKESICEFLQEQDLSTVDTTVMSIKLVEELYKYSDSRFIELELMFDKGIKIGRKEISINLTFEQVEEMKMMNVDMVDATQNMLLMELAKEILKEFNNNKKIYFSTNQNFFEYGTRIIEPHKELNSPHTEIKMTAHYKVLTTKDLRKLKLNEIESK